MAQAVSLTSSAWLFCLALAGYFLLATIAQGRMPDRPRSAETAFLAESDTAMATMMDAMTIKPSGNVDADFAAMMIPHHQGAIAMALTELRHGHNEALRRIAQEIVVEQQQEITAMRLALGQPVPASMASPTQPAPVASGGFRSARPAGLRRAPSATRLELEPSR